MPQPDAGTDSRAQKVIAIGASAGGVEAVLELARGLPADLPAAVLVVIHTYPTSPPMLAGLIDNAGALSALYAQDGVFPLAGHIYLAPPDHHLLIGPKGRMRLWRGPKENGSRPAIDPLFRTVARAYGRSAFGVILTGYLDDGALGLMLVKRHGGVAIVQDPATAAVPDMARAAMRAAQVDFVIPLREMPELFTRLTATPPTRPAPSAAGEHAMSAESREPDPGGGTLPNSIERKEATDGAPASLTCAECGGALSEQRVGHTLRYSCHLGHAYTGETLEDQYVREVEAALWTATRRLTETAELHRRMGRRLRATGQAERGGDYELRAEESERQSRIIRDLIEGDLIGNMAARAAAAGADARTSSAVEALKPETPPAPPPDE